MKRKDTVYSKIIRISHRSSDEPVHSLNCMGIRFYSVCLLPLHCHLYSFFFSRSPCFVLSSILCCSCLFYSFPFIYTNPPLILKMRYFLSVDVSTIRIYRFLYPSYSFYSFIFIHFFFFILRPTLSFPFLSFPFSFFSFFSFFFFFFFFISHQSSSSSSSVIIFFFSSCTTLTHSLTHSLTTLTHYTLPHHTTPHHTTQSADGHSREKEGTLQHSHQA